MAIKLAGRRFDYILLDDQDSAQPTVFVLRELTAGDRSRLIGLYPEQPADALSRAQLIDFQRAVAAADRELCVLGIEAVRGIQDAAGNPVDMPVAQVIASLADPRQVQELAAAVLVHNRLGSDEAKNSDGQP